MSTYNTKKTVALFYGGPSPEHDVSVITALQVMHAIDQQRFEVLLVYISPDGRWFVGDALKDRANYVFDVESIKQLTPVTLDVNRADAMKRAGRLRSISGGLFGGAGKIVAEFDVVIPAFHGLYGEDGHFQGLMEFAGIPYAGMRGAACSLLMDKVATKRVLKALSIDALPFAYVNKPGDAIYVDEAVIQERMKASGIDFPCIVKPVHLGSSIGVAKCDNAEEVSASLGAIFKMDQQALIEPYVDPLLELNVAVAKIEGQICLSAIERPKATEELLDFKQKYMSGGGQKTGLKSGEKQAGALSQGMLSLTRELNPDVAADILDKIQKWSEVLFDSIGGTGAPRIDYILNGDTGQIWLNEVNPFPGSSGYFLWEARESSPLLFSELMDHLIDEAFTEHKKCRLPKDPVPRDARLLKRSLSEG